MHGYWRRIVQRRPGTSCCFAVSAPSREHSVHDLLDKTLSDPQWAIRGLVPAALSLLAGTPKMSKS
jgi:hypothetical protein